MKSVLAQLYIDENMEKGIRDKGSREKDRDESIKRAGERREDHHIEESSEYDLEEDEESWISWFCGLRGNEMLVEVPESFIRDRFNLTGLSHQVPFYERALLIVLEMEDEKEDTLESLREEHQVMIEAAAEMLYGLIHARFIVSTQGLSMMRRK